jgi:hypothetical protein
MADVALSNNQYTFGQDQAGVSRLLSVNADEIAVDWLKEIELITRQSGMGDLQRAHYNMLRGINYRGTGNPVVSNLDNTGLTFFTRPRMALPTDNLQLDRKLAQLATTDSITLQRMVRCLLDHVGEVNRGVITPLTDPRLPFIPVLTNNLLSLSGWPDPVMNYWTSKAGNWKEAMALVDDVYICSDVFQLTANYSNTAGDPISLLIDTWCTYASYVYIGIFDPYPDSIALNEVDYQTRIYQLVLDPGRRFIQKIAATGASFPTSTPMGASFNFDSTKPYNFNNGQLSIPFTCTGAMYNDPILFLEFNALQTEWCGDMGKIVDDRTTGKSTGPSGWRQITVDQAMNYNYMALPHIHIYTSELQWWITDAEYTMFKQ